MKEILRVPTTAVTQFPPSLLRRSSSSQCVRVGQIRLFVIVNCNGLPMRVLRIAVLRDSEVSRKSQKLHDIDDVTSIFQHFVILHHLHHFEACLF
jgi:hypothetical protein